MDCRRHEPYPLLFPLNLVLPPSGLSGFFFGLHLSCLYPTQQQKTYVVPKYSKAAIAGDWVFIWQNTGAVFRLRLSDDGMFESIPGIGSGQLGGRWNTWDADRWVFVVHTSSTCRT